MSGPDEPKCPRKSALSPTPCTLLLAAVKFRSSFPPSHPARTDPGFWSASSRLFVWFGLVPSQSDSPCPIYISWITIPRAEYCTILCGAQSSTCFWPMNVPKDVRVLIGCQMVTNMCSKMSVLFKFPPPRAEKLFKCPHLPSRKLPDYCFNFSEASIMLLKLCSVNMVY